MAHVQQRQQKPKQKQKEAKEDNHHEMLDIRAETQALSSPSSSSSSQGSFFDLIYRGIRRCAATSIGIIVIDKMSQGLKIVEQTAKWSLPKPSGDGAAQQTQGTRTRLERPLPWIPFLALIISLRIIHLFLSIAALVIGNDPIQAKDTIHFMQTRRRKLRGLRLYACRAIHDRQQQSWTVMLRKLFSKLVCRPRLDSEVIPEQFNSFSTPDSTGKAPQTSPKKVILTRSHAEDCTDEFLSVDQILDKYGAATEDTSADSDFIPDLEAQATDTSTSSPSSSANTTTSDGSYSNNQDLSPMNIKGESVERDDRKTTIEKNLNGGGGRHAMSNAKSEKFADGSEKLNNNFHPEPEPESTIPPTIVIGNHRQLNGNPDLDEAVKTITTTAAAFGRSATPGHESAANSNVVQRPLLVGAAWSSCCQCSCHWRRCRHQRQSASLVMKGTNGGCCCSLRSSSSASPQTSSSEDLFYSPIDSPKLDIEFEFPSNLTANAPNPDAAFVPDQEIPVVDNGEMRSDSEFYLNSISFQASPLPPSSNSSSSSSTSTATQLPRSGKGGDANGDDGQQQQQHQTHHHTQSATSKAQHHHPQGKHRGRHRR